MKKITSNIKFANMKAPLLMPRFKPGVYFLQFALNAELSASVMDLWHVLNSTLPD